MEERNLQRQARKQMIEDLKKKKELELIVCITCKTLDERKAA
jgi:hypothetical protein